MLESEVETIPKMRRVLSDTYANLAVYSGWRKEDLGYATDRKVLYRWDGTALVAITIYSGSGLADNIPNAENLPEGSLYYETDTGLTKQVQSGAWAIITGNVGEGHIFVFLNAYSSIIQGAWAWAVDANLILNGTWRVASPANGDEIHYKVYLAPGTYTIGLLTEKNTDQGILDMYFDAVEVASFDLYAGSLLDNQWLTDAGNVVASTGLRTLKLKIDGKNGSSIGYSARLQALILWRTA